MMERTADAKEAAHQGEQHDDNQNRQRTSWRVELKPEAAKVTNASAMLPKKHCAAERQDLAVCYASSAALSVPGSSAPRD